VTALASQPSASNKRAQLVHPLRILAIINLPWDARLGAARVWIELSKEWEKTGHQVDRFCLTDAFPNRRNSRLTSAMRQILFPIRAAAYVRRNAGRFDVIDSLIGCLRASKASLGFEGLLVARSVGLYRLYDKFLERSGSLWPPQPKGRWFGPILHNFLARRARKDSDRSVRHCDLLNVPNEEEKRELETDAQVRAQIIVQPYGLTSEFRSALAAAAAPAAERLAQRTICFIGMWTPRKGSLDWPKIIAQIRRRHPTAKFIFLGTMFEERVVRADVGPDEEVVCHRNFTEDELPSLLSHCTVGLFPTYIEGFGLAILEQLAAGLPVIAYDVPGPHHILHSMRASLLVPAGDIAALSARAADMLELDTASYKDLSKECVTLGQSYRWEEISDNTITRYQRAMGLLSGHQGT
jgi:glycosyltransferase involved in cell wall biosynthesis